MEEIFPRIREWFLNKEPYFTTFAQADSRLEGWFKGEMLALLERLQTESLIHSCTREFNIHTPSGPKKRRQIDFRIGIGSRFDLCELKALCISQAAGTPRDLHFYLQDDDVGLVKDFKKLPELPTSDHLWLLAFVYPAPSSSQWKAALRMLETIVGGWACLTSPEQFPAFLYLSLWKPHRILHAA